MMHVPKENLPQTTTYAMVYAIQRWNAQCKKKQVKVIKLQLFFCFGFFRLTLFFVDSKQSNQNRYRMDRQMKGRRTVQEQHHVVLRPCY